MRPTRDRRLWFARAVFCVLGVLLLSIPAQALADLPGEVGDVIDDVTEGAGDAVDEVVEEVDDVVEPVTEGVGDVVEPVTEEAGDVAGSVTEGAGDAVDEATEIVDEVVDDVSGAVDDVAGSASDAAGTVGGAADGVIGSLDQTVASSPTASSDGHGGGGGGGGGGGTEPTPRGPAAGFTGSASPTGGARWMHREVDRPYFRWDFSGDVLGLRVPSAQVVEGGTGPSEDPCDADVQLVCLGLLYGLGEFADTPAQVLGFLATTGIGMIALVKLAVGLGIAGSTALVGSRRYGAAATVGRTS